jgi:hypothetical protein
MSDDTKALLDRIASLETQLSPQRKDDGKPVFDLRKAQLDPINYFKKMGMDVTQLTRHFVANALGKDCPPELSAMVQMGPQIVAQSNLEELTASLSRKVEQLTEKLEARETAQSLKNTPVDPSKYPTLSAAVKANPELLEQEMKSLGKIADPDEAYKKLEDKLSPYAKAFGFKPPSPDSSKSGETSNTTTVTETRPDFRPANNGTTGSEVPSLFSGSSSSSPYEGVDNELKAAVLKKWSSVS